MVATVIVMISTPAKQRNEIATTASLSSACAAVPNTYCARAITDATRVSMPRKLHVGGVALSTLRNLSKFFLGIRPWLPTKDSQERHMVAQVDMRKKVNDAMSSAIAVRRSTTWLALELVLVGMAKPRNVAPNKKPFIVRRGESILLFLATLARI